MKKKKKRLKYWIGRLHLWLGLIVGAIVFIISITGAMYAFQGEFTSYFRRNAIYNKGPVNGQTSPLPIRVLEKKVNEYTGETDPLHWVTVPVDKRYSYIFYYYEYNADGATLWQEYPLYRSVYIDPYSGEVLGSYDETNDFFNIVKSLHYSFLLNTGWGPYVSGIPTLIFVFMLISGIILWWPKNKAALKHRFWFNWKSATKWRRKNYDLHSILGFYASLLALIVAITGLFYAFFFVQAAMYVVFSGGSTTYPDFSDIKTEAPVEARTDQTIDKIGQKVEQLYPNAYVYTLDLGHPHGEDEEHQSYSVYVQQLDYSYHINHQLIFDENSGELLHTHGHDDKNFGEKVVSANYDIHVGEILGLPGKVLAFCLSLICASLPVSGFMVWWGRKKRSA